MGLASNNYRLLYLTAGKSDIEYKISILCQKRIMLMSQSKHIAALQAGNIFQTGERESSYDGGNVNPLPGLPGNYTGADETNDVDTIPASDYEAQLSIIQDTDAQYAIEVKLLDTMLEAKKTEIESVKKLLDNDIKVFGKIFNH